MKHSELFGRKSVRWITITSIIIFSAQVSALELRGKTQFSALLAVNSAVSGVVKAVYANPGQRVKRGETLLRLDDRPFQARLNSAKAMVAMQQPVREKMLTEMEKAQELYDRDSLALVEMQNAEYNLQISEAELAVAEARLQLASYDLDQVNLKSPDDLLVLEVNTHRGQFINTAVSDKALMVLANHHEMLAIAYLGPDQWDAELQGKTVSVDYLGNRYSGKIIGLDYRRNSGANRDDGFELRVLFVASGEIPANMPVTIDIPK